MDEMLKLQEQQKVSKEAESTVSGSSSTGSTCFTSNSSDMATSDEDPVLREAAEVLVHYL